MTLERRYLALAAAQAVTDLDAVEAALGLALPPEVRHIAGFYPGGSLGGIEHLDWSAASPNSVVSATLAARRARSVAEAFVLLAEPPESVIVLRIGLLPAVVWGHAHDFERLVSGQTPVSDVDAFPTYADFFASLLAAEEEGWGTT